MRARVFLIDYTPEKSSRGVSETIVVLDQDQAPDREGPDHASGATGPDPDHSTTE